MDDLKEAVNSKQKIVWTQFAMKHGIKGQNGGQVAKEFASVHGFDTTQLSARKYKTGARSTKKHFSGTNISIPIPPTQKIVKNAIMQMVVSGEILVGQACCPYNITQFIVKDGNVSKETKVVQGRKIPFHELRLKLLQSHEQFMHLYPDEKIQIMEKNELQQHLSKCLCIESASVEEMRELLTAMQRTRTLSLWHDHATILGRGYILITIHTVYDDMVFKHDEDITMKTHFKCLCTNTSRATNDIFNCTELFKH